jgi:hypothetical protein
MKLTFGKRIPDSDPRRVGAILGTAYLAIAAWIAAASITLGAEFTRSRPADQASPNAAIAGAFTGAWVNGAPVYRLPSISVTGHRDAEFAARQPRDEDRLRARQIRTSAPVRPCPHVAESIPVSNSLRVM